MLINGGIQPATVPPVATPPPPPPAIPGFIPPTRQVGTSGYTIAGAVQATQQVLSTYTPPPPPAPPVAVAASGYGFDTDQLKNIHIVLALGQTLRAPRLAVRAALVAGRGELNYHTYGCNASDHCGFWQLSASLQREHAYTDVAYWTRRAYLTGNWIYGGIIPIAKAHPTYSPGRIANMCQGAYANLDEGAAYYDQFNSEADWIISHIDPPPIKVAPPAVPAQPRRYGQVRTALKALDWAGDLENAFKAILSGAERMRNNADRHRADFAAIQQVTTPPPR